MVATSPKMAEELLGLGLPAETANMCWCTSDFESTWLVPRTPSEVKNSLLEGEFDDVKLVPAWSLGALLEVMPEKITDGRYNYYLESDLKSEIYYNAIGAMIPNRKGYTKKDNIFEAAFEMVKWLLKMEIIKKSK